MTQYCVLSSQITSVGYVGNVICLKFAQESFKVLFEKELVKNMMYLVWELNPRLSVHETDTLPSELTRFLHLPIAQLVERQTVVLKVVGSNTTR